MVSVWLFESNVGQLNALIGICPNVRKATKKFDHLIKTLGRTPSSRMISHRCTKSAAHFIVDDKKGVSGEKHSFRIIRRNKIAFAILNKLLIKWQVAPFPNENFIAMKLDPIGSNHSEWLISNDSFDFKAVRRCCWVNTRWPLNKAVYIVFTSSFLLYPTFVSKLSWPR